MRSVENIYLAKLQQVQTVFEKSAAKRAVFADYFERAYNRTAEASISEPTDVFAAGYHTGYEGGALGSGSDIDAAVENAARATGLKPALIRAVIMTESSFRVNAVSSAGAQGLMQLMPKTAKSLGVDNSFDVHQNVMGGSVYLKKQLDRFGDLRLALAAYNTGPGRVASYGISDANNPSEYEKLSPRVRRYVDRVLDYYEQYASV